MLLVIFFIVYAGVGFERYLRVSHAAKVAARSAAIARFDGVTACQAAQDAKDAAMGPDLAPDTNVEDCTEGPPGTDVTVTIEYDLPPIPFITGITGPITVTASATERRE
jgi:Flp pilus assembly protein TadG